MKRQPLDVVRLIAALTGPITAVGVIVVAIVNYSASQSARAAADQTHQKLETIETLANGHKTYLLKVQATDSRRLAEITKLAADVSTAEEAERIYQARLVEEKEFKETHNKGTK